MSRTIRDIPVCLTIQSLNRMFEIDPVPDDVEVDAFVYRTRGEIDYVASLMAIRDSLLPG